MKIIDLTDGEMGQSDSAISNDLLREAGHNNLSISEFLGHFGEILSSFIRPGTGVLVYIDNDGENGGIVGVRLEAGDLNKEGDS